MLQYLKNEANLTHTENGAVTYLSTQSECLDLFATIGALRRESDEEITNRFLRAYAENADLAMKMLFFARDIRGGIGERRVFRTIIKWLAANEPQSLEKNLSYIAEYGRYDDLLTLMGTSCENKVLSLIKMQLESDCAALEAGDTVSLLAKWLPSINASNEGTIRQAKRIARALNMNDAQYRKTLSALRAKINIIENNLRVKDYTFDYAKQPSKAMFKYRKAFMRNDGERYAAFMERVSEGAEQIHIQAFIPPDTDMQSATKMRSVLRKLASIADRYKCAVILIGHMNKGSGAKTLYRGLGSIDIAAIARSVLMISRDESRPGIRYIYPIKSSLAPEGPAVAFSFKEQGGIVWHGRYDLNTAELMDSITVKTTKRERARAKLIQLLENEDRPAKEIYAGLGDIGVGSRTVEKVKKELQVTTYRSGGSWYWSLPKPK